VIDPSTAEVLNKAMDMAKNGIIAGYELVRQNAPLVWAMARRQTLIDGIEMLGLGGIVGGLALYSFRKFKKADKSDWEEAYVFSILGLCVLSFVTTMLLIKGVDLTFNPDWWTLRALVDMVTKKD